jgi:hypothetical protein
MYFADKFGAGYVQFIEASADEYAFAVEHRPHGAVADENALLDGR